MEATVYLLGSPGAGKTRFMNRLKDVSGGTLVIESGIFALFQKHVIDFVRRKREAGYDRRITDFFVEDDSDLGNARDPDFQLPEIDGVNIWNCLMSAIPLDKTLDEVAEDNPFRRGKGADAVCRNLPYSGWGAYHYRESLGDRIKSGGKSGFPDWLFIPRNDGKYVQVISFPGHHRIADFAANQSIPKVPAPSSAIYLVDPDIDQFDRRSRRGMHDNDAIKQVGIHLKEALALEKKGVRVEWFLSKTQPRQLEAKQSKAIKKYSYYFLNQDLSEIVRRVPNLRGFDSLESPGEEVLAVLKTALSN